MKTDHEPPLPRTFRGFTLHPFQAEAIDAIEAGRSVLVAAPTGAGKTLVADYAVEEALRRGERIVYTSPIKALSNQKFRDFRSRHGDSVGIMTGDVTINRDAPLLIMTTEVFRNTIFEDPAQLAGIRYAIFDEIHYIDDFERGTVWEEAIIFAPSFVKFVCLSATVPNVGELADWIERTRGGEVAVVTSESRPVPLTHFFHMGGPKLLPLIGQRPPAPPRGRRGRKAEVRPDELLDLLGQRSLLPCLWFCFSRRDCEKLAGANARRDLLTPAERETILASFEELKERYQLVEDAVTERLRRAASRGVMFHHAGLLPIAKEIVERLFTTGLVKLLFTTETFALGVNMPARTVVFHQLKKFDGIAFDWLRTRDYYQMAGRAGRQGIDEEGYVVSRLDPRYDDPAGAMRIVRGRVEPVSSRFNLSYSGLLSLYRRLGEHVGEAYARSFARFQRERRRGGRERRQAREERTIEQRLSVLRRSGYIDGTGLTEKGRFAEFLNGYEVQSTELYAAGLLDHADEVQLAILFVAMVFEERKGDASALPPRGVLGELKTRAERTVREFRKVEAEAGLSELTKEPDFRMAAPTYEWANGEPFSRIREVTSITDGDLVRNFRMAIQLLRQIRSQLPGEPDLTRRLGRALDLLNRDEVDARRQLELG
ncbi:MAG: DEAD/DEAH box helicase [Planctomycetes bacterium]|jgi:superfamily II RNA helicase|nr:DEAD/DEAH box helicase [Planctomycetota bacterium]